MVRVLMVSPETFDFMSLCRRNNLQCCLCKLHHPILLSPGESKRFVVTFVLPNRLEGIKSQCTTASNHCTSNIAYRLKRQKYNMQHSRLKLASFCMKRFRNQCSKMCGLHIPQSVPKVDRFSCTIKY